MNTKAPSGNPYPFVSGRPCNAAEMANDRLAGHAKEAMRLFIAKNTGVDPADVIFPELTDCDRFVEMLTALRHFARHIALDYRFADRLARKRHDKQYAAEAAQSPVQEK